MGSRGESKGAIEAIHGTELAMPRVADANDRKTIYSPRANVLLGRKSYPYPPPYTDEFCQLYAERLSSFVHATQLFAGAVEHIASARSAAVSLASEQALETINLLRRPISAVVERNAKGALEQSWQTPSLLASFAEMFVQDVAFGRATRLCDCCQLPFVSGAYQASAR